MFAHARAQSCEAVLDSLSRLAEWVMRPAKARGRQMNYDISFSRPYVYIYIYIYIYIHIYICTDARACADRLYIGNQADNCVLLITGVSLARRRRHSSLSISPEFQSRFRIQ